MPADTNQFLREQSQPVGSVTLNVARTGTESPDVIFLHGVTRRWQSFLPIVAPLAVRHRLELLDLRGHGASGRASGYRVIDYVGDVVERLGQLAAPVVLYGHSLGAMVAAGADSIAVSPLEQASRRLPTGRGCLASPGRPLGLPQHKINHLGPEDSPEIRAPASRLPPD
ncbi:MAG: alpha/beta fold hydrolase, partial [Planctomycetaceae bacterium]